MVTTTRYIFTAIFPREYLFAIKFLTGNEKSMGHFWYQNLKKFEEKLQK